MATFSLQQRHHEERIAAAKAQARIALEVGHVDRHPNHPAGAPGGDPRYRIPAVGLNPGAMPGTRPDMMEFA